MRCAKKLSPAICATVAVALSVTSINNAKTVPQGLSSEVLEEWTPLRQTSSLDRPAPKSGAQYELVGRIAKVPVSSFFKTTLTVPAGTDLQLKTPCSQSVGVGAAFRVCDTGMIVTFRQGSRDFTLFNDDGPLAEVGGNGHGSYVRTGLFWADMQVTVFVFSMRRATSSTQLLENRGLGWIPVGMPLDVGGTLVGVGPLQNGDFIEVTTQSNGAGDDNTQMLLFSPDTPRRAALFNQDRLTPFDPIEGIGDADPRLDITDETWLGKNFALLGKESRSSASNKGVETRVDVIHGPLDVSATSTKLDWGMWLAPGRYYVWIEAGTDSPVGHFGSGALPEPHPNSDMDRHLGWNTLNLACSGLPSNRYKTIFNRGAPNGMALVLRVEDWNNGSPKTLRQRTVPRGAFGSHVSLSYNRFLFEIELMEWTNVVVRVPWKAADVHVWPDWWARRNPDASELKVATYNMLYEEDYEDAKFKNASNLLATRGSILRNELRVEERLDQAPWQWDADIIGLQEVRKRCSSDCWEGSGTFRRPYLPNWHGLAEVFRAEANARGPLAWQYVKGRDEAFTFTPAGLGPLFINEYFWRFGQDSNSIFFRASSRERAKCTEKPIEYAECHLGGCSSPQRRAADEVPQQVPPNGSNAIGDEDCALLQGLANPAKKSSLVSFHEHWGAS